MYNTYQYYIVIVENRNTCILFYTQSCYQFFFPLFSKKCENLLCIEHYNINTFATINVSLLKDVVFVLYPILYERNTFTVLKQFTSTMRSKCEEQHALLKILCTCRYFQFHLAQKLISQNFFTVLELIVFHPEFPSKLKIFKLF